MKDKNTAALLALFLGGIGAHRFYLGQIGWGIVYFVFCWTIIPSMVAVIEFIVLLLMDQDEFNRRYNGSNTLPPGQALYLQMLPPGVTYGAGAHGGMPGAGRVQVPDLVTQLEKLNELRIAGLLTDEEFQRQKAKLLDAM